MQQARKRRPWLKWGLILAGLIAIPLLLGAGFFGLMVLYFNPSPPKPDYQPPAGLADAQTQDLDYLKRFLTLDRSFSPQGRRAAAQIITELEAQAGQMSAGAFELGVARVAAQTDNAHSNVSSGPRSRRLGRLPIRVFLFDDGLHIIRAHADVADLLGAQIDAFDTAQTGTVLETLRPYYGGTNEFYRNLVPLLLEAPTLLEAAGLIDEANAVTLALTMPDGSRTHRRLTALPANPDDARAFPYDFLGPDSIDGEGKDWVSLLADRQLPLWLQESDKVFRRDRLEDGGLYVQFKVNYSTTDQSIGDFLDNVLDEAKTHPPPYVVIDLRFNGGGDYTMTHKAMTRLPKLLPDGTPIYALTSNTTFSAGITSLVFLKGASAPGQTLILGKLAGDRMRFWSEGNAMVLPNSGIHMRYSTGFHAYDGECGPPSRCYWLNYYYRPRTDDIRPDHALPFLFADYLAGRDLVMEKVAELQAAK